MIEDLVPLIFFIPLKQNKLNLSPSIPLKSSVEYGKIYTQLV